MAFNLNFEELKDLRNAFQEIDTDGNGIITLEEFTHAFEKNGVHDANLEKVFKTIDANQTGCISYSEFLASAMRRKMFSDEEKLIEAFDRLDVDGNGYLEIDDFKQLMGEEFNQQEVEEMIRSADKSKDGKIDFDEFMQMMRDAYARTIKKTLPEGTILNDYDLPTFDDEIKDKVPEEPPPPLVQIDIKKLTSKRKSDTQLKPPKTLPPLNPIVHSDTQNNQNIENTNNNSMKNRPASVGIPSTTLITPTHTNNEFLFDNNTIGIEMNDKSINVQNSSINEL